MAARKCGTCGHNMKFEPTRPDWFRGEKVFRLYECKNCGRLDGVWKKPKKKKSKM